MRRSTSSVPDPAVASALARLLQLASPTLPVGAFTYSQGLEWAVEAGLVVDEASAAEWIGSILSFSVARYDAPLLASQMRAWGNDDYAEVRRLNREFIASRETAEFRAEATQMGYSLMRLLSDLAVADEVVRAALAEEAEIALPTAWSLAADRWRVPIPAALTAYLWSWLENQVMAALKAIPLGQTAGQRLLLSLGSGLDELAAHASELPRGAVGEYGTGIVDCQHAARDAVFAPVPFVTGNGETACMSSNQPLRVGIGGPVGSGKTALTLALCRALRDRYRLAVVTNDIYTAEDAQFLVRNEALSADRIIGVETGGCPHTAIREDASINLEAVARLNALFPDLELIFIESGGDNLAATFSPELSDLTLYVIDVSAGDKIPRKGGPGITKSDLLVINKIDLAPYVGASLEVMDRDAKKMRGERPFVFSNLKTGDGLEMIINFIEASGLLLARRHA